MLKSWGSKIRPQTMQLSNVLTSLGMGWGSESRKYTSPQLEHFTMKGIANYKLGVQGFITCLDPNSLGMGIYESVEKILKYRVERTARKGILSRGRIGNFVKIAISGIFALLLTGIMNINPRNFPNTTLFTVVNLVYLVAMYMILTTIEKNSRDRTLFYIGVVLVMMLMMFSSWFITFAIR